MEVAFYVVGHPDDWQLFMTPRAHSDLCWPVDQCRIVFIYLTAGDNVSFDDNGDPTKDPAYWYGREVGSLYSIQAARDDAGQSAETFVHSIQASDDPLVPDAAAPKPAPETSTHCGHPIVRYEYSNTVSYYFRLPEHRVARTADVAGVHPLAWTPDSTAASDTDSYASWDDLVETLADIMTTETEGETRGYSWVNYLDPRFTQHDDHTLAGWAVEAAIDRLGRQTPARRVEPERFFGYRIANPPFTENDLTTDQIAAKSKIFDTYDRVANIVTANRYGRHMFGAYLTWLNREFSLAKTKQLGLTSPTPLRTTPS